AARVGLGVEGARPGKGKQGLEPLRRDSCPFVQQPELPNPTVWVEPKVVAEVKFQDWTDDGSLRAPVFLRFRDDLDPREVRRQAMRKAAAPVADAELAAILRQLDNGERAPTAGVDTHQPHLPPLAGVPCRAPPPLKQPALTKRDLLRYFVQVSPHMLPHLADRPLTMIRMPDGIHGQRFYQK